MLLLCVCDVFFVMLFCAVFLLFLYSFVFFFFQDLAAMGPDVILTLRDKGVLDEDQDEVLENVKLAETERQKGYKDALKPKSK